MFANSRIAIGDKHGPSEMINPDAGEAWEPALMDRAAGAKQPAKRIIEEPAQPPNKFTAMLTAV